MDFEELLAQAGSNAKKLNKKVKEADREMKYEQRTKMERLAMQRKYEKEELKRKAPPKPQPPPKPKFVIPKKEQTKAEVDKEQLQRFLNRQENTKRQMELQKKQEKEELIRLRMEAMGGKANKKIAKHFGKSPIELQMRYGRGDSEQLDRLVKDKEREEEQQEKLNALYRTGAFKAKNTLLEKNPNASSSKDSINRTPQIQRPSSSSKKISPNSSIPSSSKAFSSQPRPNHSKPIEKKRKIPEAEDFSLLMRKAEQNRSIDPSAAEDFFPDPPPTKQPKSTKQDELGVTAGRSLTYNTARAAAKKDKDEREKREELYRKEVLAKERVLANGGPITKPKPVASSLNSTKPSMDRSKFSATSSRVTASSASSKKDVRTNSKPAVAPQSSNLRELAPVLNTPGKILRVDPELGPVREKRYLPGDIRYKPEPGKALPEKKVANGRVHPDVSALAKQRKDVVGKSVASSSKGISEKMNGSRKPPQPEFKVPSSSKLPPKRKTEAELRAEMELRKREAKLLERELEERRVREEQRKAEISINKLKREEMRRFEQKKQLMMNRRGRDHDREREHRKTGPSRFANFSETDEDEDEDVDEYDDTEYDSEMDDFIDDTELDDLQRKDIEETLRLINPRYDKKKWKMREMMIDDRRMDARFRDIETEERHSTRMGLIEDLKEAKKGSKSIG